MSGRRAAPKRLGSLQPAYRPALGVDARLDRGRGRGEHDRRLLEPGAHDAHVAGVVDDAVLLFVGALVLLVDDDQAEVGEGQEERRARADDRPRLAARDRAPGPLALARREARVPFRRARAEARREPVEKLRGERDLRQQHERLPALSQRLGDRLEIDFRLAGAGDAFEQGRGEGPGRDAGLEVGGGRLLVGVEDGPKVRDEVGGDRFPAAFDERERPVLDEAVDHARGAAGAFGERGLGRAARRAAPERAPPSTRAARLRHPRRRALAGRDHAEFRGAAAHASWARPPCAAPCRGARASSGPPSRRSRAGLSQRRPVAHGRDRLQVVAAASRTAQTTPVAWRVPSGTPTKPPGASARSAGDAVAVGGVDRDGHEHVDDAARPGRIVGRRAHPAGLAHAGGSPPGGRRSVRLRTRRTLRRATATEPRRAVTGSCARRRSRERSCWPCSRKDRLSPLSRR